MKVRTLMLIISLLVAGPAAAGWFEDTVTNAMKRVTERGIDDAADGAYNAGKKAVTEDEEEKPRKRKAQADDEETSSESAEEETEESSKE